MAIPLAGERLPTKMVHTIVMPDLGQTTAEGKVLRWLKSPGEEISKGDHLLEVETDKVTMEVESYLRGYLRQLLAQLPHFSVSDPVFSIT